MTKIVGSAIRESHSVSVVRSVAAFAASVARQCRKSEPFDFPQFLFGDVGSDGVFNANAFGSFSGRTRFLVKDLTDMRSMLPELEPVRSGYHDRQQMASYF